MLVQIPIKLDTREYFFKKMIVPNFCPSEFGLYEDERFCTKGTCFDCWHNTLILKGNILKDESDR